MGTVFLLHIRKHFDVFTAKRFPQSQEPSGRTLNYPGASDMGETIPFDPQEIEAGPARNFKGGFICGLEYLDPDGPVKPAPDFTGHRRQGADGFSTNWRLNIRQVVVVLQNDAVYAGGLVSFQV